MSQHFPKNKTKQSPINLPYTSIWGTGKILADQRIPLIFVELRFLRVGWTYDLPFGREFSIFRPLKVNILFTVDSTAQTPVILLTKMGLQKIATDRNSGHFLWILHLN